MCADGAFLAGNLEAHARVKDFVPRVGVGVRAEARRTDMGMPIKAACRTDTGMPIKAARRTDMGEGGGREARRSDML